MMATGSYSFVGSAQGAFKANDSVSGQLLAAAIDKGLGGTSIKNVDVFQWGDAENAIDYWANLTETGGAARHYRGSHCFPFGCVMP
jgi:hypothetical protein